MSLPRWRHYVDALPEGVESYKECTVKASLIRQFYEAFGKPALDDALPAAVRELALNPPPVSVSVPEIVVNTLRLSLADSLGYSDEEFIAKAREVSRTVAAAPMYRLLFAFVSPDRLLKNAATRWGALHRGTSLSVELVEDTRCRILMHAPPYASTELLSMLKATGIDVALVAAGAKNLQTKVKQVTPMVAQFDAVWTR